MKIYGTTDVFDATSPKTSRYKGIIYQGSYELFFLENLNDVIIPYVKRPHSVIYYLDGKKRRYYPDFLLFDKIIVEIKSNWTYDKNGGSAELRNENLAKYSAVIENTPYEFVLLIGMDEIEKYSKIINQTIINDTTKTE